MAAAFNILLLIVQAVIYFGAMSALFRARRVLGIGVFVSSLGVMHFLETYLASVFYVSVPVGTISPGSTVLFSGKLAMLLLLYIKEDAETVRQPIYGLLLGNFLIVALTLVLRLHETVAVAGRQPDVSFIDEMGWLMVWGTSLLFVDSIAMILIYEKLGRVFGERVMPRALGALALTLTFDQIGFYAILHWLTGAPVAVLYGGWAAKMVAALVFSVMLAFYLSHIEARPLGSARRLGDVFDRLTYRHRYEALLERAGLDELTGLHDRGRFEEAGRNAFEHAAAIGQPLSLLMVDVDHLKAINEVTDYATGDEILKDVAKVLVGSLRPTDQAFRYGGEEFAVLCNGMEHEAAIGLAERIRMGVATVTRVPGRPQATVSVGVATYPGNANDFGGLVRCADARMYGAKHAGRNRTIADRAVEYAMRGSTMLPGPERA